MRFHNPMLTVDIVLPCYNEEMILKDSVSKLFSYLESQFPHKWRIIIAENCSRDNTLRVAEEIKKDYSDKVSVVTIKNKGRGGALRCAWESSNADIVSYMDADLSTDVACFLPLIEEILSGVDIAVGNRLSPDSNVKRTLVRTMLSVTYNFLIRSVFGIRQFSDAQCGFKAARRECAVRLLKSVKNREWFFDTELLILAERAGLKIKQIPISWVQSNKSSVKLLKTIIEDIKEITKLKFLLLNEKK